MLNTIMPHTSSLKIPGRRVYFTEFDGREEALERNMDACSRLTLTSLFATKDTAHNYAVALKRDAEARIVSGQ